MRRSTSRRETPALAAAQRGRPLRMRNPADTQREARRKRRRKAPGSRILDLRRSIKRAY